MKALKVELTNERVMRNLFRQSSVIIAIVTFSTILAASVFGQPQRSPVDTPVVYRIAGMENIKPKREAYKTVDDGQLNFDLYQPPGLKSGERRGVVVFANWKGRGRNEWALMVSWGRLVAASGLNAVIYQSAVKPDEDMDDIVQYLRKNAAKLQIDENSIGMFTTSGNTVATMPFITTADRTYIRCAVIYYGMLSFGPNPWMLTVRKDLPLFIVRAGLEPAAELNKQLDAYVKMLSEQNAPVTFINYPNGHHSFDLVDDNERSREIIKASLEFLVKQLSK